MLYWHDIVTAAVLGTERRPFMPPAPGDGLGDLLARLDPADQEGALLGAAAAAALYRRAIELPPVERRPPPEPCDQDDQPRCNPQAARHLASMLGGQHREVLPEWLEVAAAADRRVPEVLLPALLELGREDADLREAIGRVLGKRGRWLAAQNPAWAYASSALSVESVEFEEDQLKILWETGTRAARFELLGRLRPAEPSRARELVAATWATERADDRVAVLATFERGLTMDDEPFLEAALDDRSREVRRAAAGLLARLPESRLVRRMAARVLPLLRWTPPQPRLLRLGPAQPPRLAVTLPSACDTGTIRDGVEPKPPRGRQIGDQAWWLMQMIAVIAPASWSRAWRAAPAEIVAATIASEWPHELLVAWVNAARNHADADWAAALLSAWAYHRQINPAMLTEFVETLLGVLPHDRRELFVINYMTTNNVATQVDSILAILRACGPHWSDELSRIVLEQIRSMLVEQKTFSWNAHAGFQEFALRMSPRLVPEAAAAWPKDGQEWWRAVIDRFLIVLQFRHDMHKEFENL